MSALEPEQPLEGEVMASGDPIEELRQAIAHMTRAVTECVAAGHDVVDAFDQAGMQVPPMVRPMIAMALRGLR